MNKEIQILNPAQIESKIDRLAYQLLERNYHAKHLVLVGLNKNGWILSQRLFEKIKKIQSDKISMILPFEIQKGISPDLDSLPKEEYALILVDDVANSGKTFLNAIQKFFNTPAKSIQCLALIDRSHKLFPIHCDFVGLHLSTTLQEHIYVQLEENASLDKAWLT